VKLFKDSLKDYLNIPSLKRREKMIVLPLIMVANQFL
jgi:hypothetical protein